jgi:hypothetical protein
MSRGRTAAAISTLVFLSLAGLDSIYWALFSMWMTAYPFADLAVWRPRVYIWLAITALIAFLWSAVVLWLVRQRRKGRQAGQSTGKS